MGIDRMVAAAFGLMALVVGLIGLGTLGIVFKVTGRLEIVQLLGPLAIAYTGLLLLASLALTLYVTIRRMSRKASDVDD